MNGGAFYIQRGLIDGIEKALRNELCSIADQN